MRQSCCGCKAVAGRRVMVEQIETGRVTDELETLLHVLTSPAWSMKVLAPLDEVTEDQVRRVMALAAILGGGGVPSVQ